MASRLLRLAFAMVLARAGASLADNEFPAYTPPAQQGDKKPFANLLTAAVPKTSIPAPTFGDTRTFYISTVSAQRSNQDKDYETADEIVAACTRTVVVQPIVVVGPDSYLTSAGAPSASKSCSAELSTGVLMPSQQTTSFKSVDSSIISTTSASYVSTSTVVSNLAKATTIAPSSEQPLGTTSLTSPSRVSSRSYEKSSSVLQSHSSTLKTLVPSSQSSSVSSTPEILVSSLQSNSALPTQKISSLSTQDATSTTQESTNAASAVSSSLETASPQPESGSCTSVAAGTKPSPAYTDPQSGLLYRIQCGTTTDLVQQCPYLCSQGGGGLFRQCEQDDQTKTEPQNGQAPVVCQKCLQPCTNDQGEAKSQLIKPRQGLSYDGLNENEADENDEQTSRNGFSEDISERPTKLGDYFRWTPFNMTAVPFEQRAQRKEYGASAEEQKANKRGDKDVLRALRTEKRRQVAKERLRRKRVARRGGRGNRGETSEDMVENYEQKH